MLETLLKHIRQNGTCNLAQLERELGVSQALLEGMIEHLARMGYLQAIDACDPVRCTGCEVAARCTIVGSGRMWALVETEELS